MTALLSIPIVSYCLIERLALIYFLYPQQDHKLNENGIINKLIPIIGVSNTNSSKQPSNDFFFKVF
tara:strand:+ start:2177 stop:2374 length:198 start_codon:yes stop_codon:yes gene_type:complete